MKTRKSWREKMQLEQHPKIVELPEEGWQRMGGRTMLVSTPHDVDALIRKIPKGKIATSAQLRQKLASDFGAECTCPTSTGIFVRIAAEAAEEERAEGAKRITPYWRVIAKEGSLNEKFPGGVKAQAANLREEGFQIEPATGKKPPRVKDFESKLVKF
jgi:alkylated DNA nucleotide flippase Atl1